MQEIDITKINDIGALKALKSDQYDRLMAAQAEQNQATANINAIGARIAELQTASSEPQSDTNPIAASGGGELSPVNLEVTPGDQPKE